jgi:hypothetical protein
MVLLLYFVSSFFSVFIVGKWFLQIILHFVLFIIFKIYQDTNHYGIVSLSYQKSVDAYISLMIITLILSLLFIFYRIYAFINYIDSLGIPLLYKILVLFTPFICMQMSLFLARMDHILRQNISQKEHIAKRSREINTIMSKLERDLIYTEFDKETQILNKRIPNIEKEIKSIDKRINDLNNMRDSFLDGFHAYCSYKSYKKWQNEESQRKVERELEWEQREREIYADAERKSNQRKKEEKEQKDREKAMSLQQEQNRLIKEQNKLIEEQNKRK